MGEVHRLLREEGHEAALRSDFDQRVIGGSGSLPRQRGREVGFLYSGWAQAALPHKHLSGWRLWRTRGRATGHPEAGHGTRSPEARERRGAGLAGAPANSSPNSSSPRTIAIP